jgi:putative FmdB family regulatory protein
MDAEPIVMPIYEYLCDDCGKRYERIVFSQDQDVACPGCASQRHTLQLSVFSAHGSSSKNGASLDSGAMSGGSCACGTGGCGRN